MAKRATKTNSKSKNQAAGHKKKSEKPARQKRMKSEGQTQDTKNSLKKKKRKNPKRQQAGKEAKQHGDKAERDICQKLSIWMFQLANEDEDYYKVKIDGDVLLIARNFFRRCVKAHGYHKSGLGDIIAPDDFAFEIEVKSVKVLDFYGLIQERRGRADGENPNEESNKIWTYWAQAVRQAKKAGKLPMLIMNKHTVPSIVALPVKQAKLIFKQDFVNLRGKFGLVPLEKMLNYVYEKFTTDVLK